MNAFIMCHHAILVRMYAFAKPYAKFMHLGSEEEITLQENPQVAAPEGEEQIPEELPECPDHRPTSFL